MQKSVLAAAIAVVAVACGAYAMPGGGSSPTPGGGMSYDVTATETVHQISMHVGQRLEVGLHAASGMANWSHPKSSDTSILVPTVDPSGAAAVGVTLGAFAAIKPGQVDVTSYASPKCSPGEACPLYVAVYSLKVTVTR